MTCCEEAVEKVRKELFLKLKKIEKTNNYYYFEDDVKSLFLDVEKTTFGIDYLFVINGESFTFEFCNYERLESVIIFVLSETKNWGRFFSDWEARNIDGERLDIHDRLIHLPLKDNTIYLNLKIGACG